jgi:molybdate transport system substrate-binding protein
MRIHRAIATIVGLGVPLPAAHAHAAEIKVLSSTALKTVLEELGPQFEKTTDNKLVFSFNPAAVLKGQIEKGAAFDVAILTAPLTDDLAKQEKIVAATRVNIARAGIGVAVRKGSPKPDISTTDAFKRALANATSIGFVAQGATGIYLKTLFENLGIADELKSKIKLLDGPAGEAVAKGEVEIGLTQISEILPYSAIELVGPLPGDIQRHTNFSAGVSAASKEAGSAEALIKFLAAPAAARVIKAKGLEPG